MRLGGKIWPPEERVGRTVDVRVLDPTPSSAKLIPRQVRMSSGQGLHMPGGLRDVAYGWTAAKKLAKQDKSWIEEDTRHRNKVRYPDHNADSIALFATGEYFATMLWTNEVETNR